MNVVTLLYIVAVFALVGATLALGDRVEHDAGTFTVQRIDNRSIKRVRFVSSAKQDVTLAASGSLVPFLLSSLMGDLVTLDTQIAWVL
jgi:hypothetical protein